MEILHSLAMVPRLAVDLGIRAYQRHLSPHKGFTCAHLVAHGGRSCSAAVRAIVAERGVVRGIPDVLARFLACGRAAASLGPGGTRVRGVCCCGGIPIPFRLRA
ncbi:membrane protein insertion efficiency factor YidD [Tessaracoccus oleiagri]|uniref:Haemolytic domain-containing protein n=1 Tax=Tessaracoccus oleiagri TaxID=686624 RepID=A0A1G9LWY5_9ACTN|nr:membrane protein insertion efficiency factor YidD [Tessaracoccus oleiagri]SDL66456.1 Haemolytic domain-containing protein [Tessaracoccus oleiagri]